MGFGDRTARSDIVSYVVVGNGGPLAPFCHSRGLRHVDLDALDVVSSLLPEPLAHPELEAAHTLLHKRYLWSVPLLLPWSSERLHRLTVCVHSVASRRLRGPDGTMALALPRRRLGLHFVFGH